MIGSLLLVVAAIFTSASSFPQAFPGFPATTSSSIQATPTLNPFIIPEPDTPAPVGSNELIPTYLMPEGIPDKSKLTFALRYTGVHGNGTKCLQPYKGNLFPIPSNDNMPWMQDGCQLPQAQFRMLLNGQLQHVLSQKCLHPMFGTLYKDVTTPENTPLVIYDNCNDDVNYIQFEWVNFSLRHKGSLKCVSPFNGLDMSGNKIVLSNLCQPDFTNNFIPDFSKLGFFTVLL